MSQMKGQFNAISQQIPHTPQSDYVSSNTIRSYNIDSPQLNPMTMKNMVRTQNDMPPDPKPKAKREGSKNLLVEGNKGAWKNNGVATNKATSKNVDFDKNLESLRSFDEYVETVEYNEAYTITLDEDLFGPNFELPIQREDMEHVAQMKKLSLACIMLYMNQLFRVIKAANLERKFLFVNPSAISGTTKQLVGGSKSALLASLLNDAENDQLVFLPHVSRFHWVLFVIDLSYPIVYYLDSLRGSVHQNLKLILSIAIKLRDNAKNLKRILAWKEVECPMQSTNVECGFYVMRFMKELIVDRSILSKRDFKWKETYTQAEIDEVRVEWMNFILELDV